MLKHLISLVFLLTITSYKPIYADNKNIILPEPKPKGIFNFSKMKNKNIWPKEKENFTNNKPAKNLILPKNKPLNKKIKSIVSKNEIKSTEGMLPQKKPKKQIIVDNS